jgi:hypothetical protein
LIELGGLVLGFLSYYFLAFNSGLVYALVASVFFYVFVWFVSLRFWGYFNGLVVTLVGSVF